MPNAPTMIEQDTGRGAVFTYGDEKRSVAILVGDHPALAGLPDANRVFAANVERVHKTYQPASAVAELRRISKPMLSAVRSAIEAGRKDRRSLAEADAVLRIVPPGVDMTLASERRARIAKLDRVAQFEFVQSAELPDLAALVADGNLADLAPEAFELADARYLAMAHVTRSGMTAQFERQPTLEMLTATGPDMAAAEQAANAALEGHARRKDTLQDVERTLRDQLAVLAVALDMPPKDVLSAILTADAA